MEVTFGKDENHGLHLAGPFPNQKPEFSPIDMKFLVYYSAAKSIWQLIFSCDSNFLFHIYLNLAT
jgi:hypothetical protein